MSLFSAKGDWARPSSIRLDNHDLKRSPCSLALASQTPMVDVTISGRRFTRLSKQMKARVPMASMRASPSSSSDV